MTLCEPKLTRIAESWDTGAARKGVIPLSEFRVGGKLSNEPLPRSGIDPSGRRWRRRNYSFQHRMSRREGAVPERDDGVCLTTLRDRRAGPVKGGVRRQAPSRQREPLKAVMEPAPPPSHPIPGHLPHCPATCHFVSKSAFLSSPVPFCPLFRHWSRVCNSLMRFR